MIAVYRGRNPVQNYFGMRRDPIAFLSDVIRECGDFARINVLTLPFYLINDPGLIREALVEKSETLIIKGGTSAGLARLVGRGILTNHGDAWRESRRTLQPLFHQTELRRYYPIMVERVQESLDRWRSTFAGAAFPINRELVALSFRIGCSTLFRHVPTFEEADEFADAVRVLQGDGFERYTAGQDFTPWLPFPRNRKVNAARSVLLRLAKNAVDRGAGQPVDEILSLVFAGTESPANTLCFALALLEEHPEWREKLLSSDPGWEDVERVDLLSRVISETARLYPAGWAFERYAIEDVTLGGERVPRGARLLFSPLLLHRNTRHWREPERFDPLRFGDSPAAVEGVPRYGYLPFGAGPRSCIGSRLALAEMRITLGMILDQCRWKTEAPAPLAEGSFKIRLSRPLRVSLEWRADATRRQLKTPPPN